jgi:hypothetical protein
MSDDFVKTILASDNGLETIPNLDGVAQTSSASDEVVETTTKTWFEKIIDGIKGILKIKITELDKDMEGTIQ